MSSIEPNSTTLESTFVGRSSGTRGQIEAANERFIAAFRDGDAAALAACYTADAQLLPVNSEPITGTQAIQSFWQSVMQMGIAGARLETIEVEGAGDLAVEIGRYVLSGADGGAVDNGKYVVIWHRDGGDWKLHRDIWTTSRPAAS
jgi:uncharacterized protein (TIGR02246 family)